MRIKRIADIRLLLSRRGTAIPVSFLMLFVSLTIIVSATFYVSVVEIQARGKLVNVAVAKQSMIALENSIESLSWTPGSSIMYFFEDGGGLFETFPTENRLLVNVTDQTFQDVVFNGTIGKVVYQLPSTRTSISTLYMRGDRRAIVNQTELTLSQMYLSPGEVTPEITLTYRPLATISETGYSNGKPVNTLRLYIISLNYSTNFLAQGKFKTKATCTEVVTYSLQYNFTETITSISVKAVLDSRTDIIVLPVSSNSNGAFILVETLLCHIKLERVQGGS